MGNKIDKKSATQFVIDNRNAGQTDQQIYSELRQQYDNRRALAMLITGTPLADEKKKFKLYNIVLLALIVLVVISKLIQGWELAESTNTSYGETLIGMSPWLVIYAYIFYAIAIYEALAYRICGFFGFMLFFNHLPAKLQTSGVLDILMTFVVAAALVGLSFYIDKKLFPNFKPFSMKQDANAEYILP